MLDFMYKSQIVQSESFLKFFLTHLLKGICEELKIPINSIIWVGIIN